MGRLRTQHPHDKHVRSALQRLLLFQPPSAAKARSTRDRRAGEISSSPPLLNTVSTLGPPLQVPVEQLEEGWQLDLTFGLCAGLKDRDLPLWRVVST